MSKKLLMNTNITEQDNYRRYYQEYEGAFITVSDKSEDDTLDTSRYIDVTEIWGNTVQDENNLEDIQSVGELYVDDEGNPILDDLGKEQYKIKIESCNDINAMDSCIRKDGYRLNGENEDGSPKEQVWRGCSIITVPLHKGLIYVLNNAIRIRHMYLYDTKNNFIRKQSNVYGDHKFTVDFNGYAKFYTFTEDIPKIYFGINLDYYSSSKLPIPTQSHKATILLPCQLMKVGDVYDRLYWDSEKGKYIVEKNVKHGLLKEIPFSKYTYNQSLRPNYTQFMYRDTVNILPSSSKFITNIQQKTIIDSTLGEGLYYEAVWNGYTIRISILTENLITNDVNGLNLYLDNSVYYMNNIQTQIIETNITEKILLPCYEDKTHIFVNSTVDATMKVLVPYKEII